MAEKEFLTYQGRPLVRSGNILYYGSSGEKFIIMMEILSTKQDGAIELSDNVRIDLIYSDEKAHPNDRVVKSSKKKGLFAAMDIATIWLERALKE
ncbi:MAG: hypothetical protein J6I80_01360 [Clostridia bacterium]|nr:hypothetical protein [Clostridia bacterium]